jgi:hypothetical protein
MEGSKMNQKHLGRTETSVLFALARKLTPGKAVFRTFATRKQAESLRVSLYRERNRLEDYTVDISIEENRVILTKARDFISYGMIDENGIVTEETVTVKTDYDKELAEIYESAKENEWKQELIDELVENLNERYGRI